VFVAKTVAYRSFSRLTDARRMIRSPALSGTGALQIADKKSVDGSDRSAGCRVARMTPHAGNSSTYRKYRAAKLLAAMIAPTLRSIPPLIQAQGHTQGDKSKLRIKPQSKS